LIPKGLIIGTSVGLVAGVIFGLVFVDLKPENSLEFVEGSSLSVITEKVDYEKGEDVSIRIINSGTVPLTFSDASYGLQITGLDGTRLYSPISAQVISVLEPKEEVSFVWNQVKDNDENILQGTYKIKSSAFDPEEKTIKDSITINIYK